MTRSANVSPLQFVKRIPQQNLSHNSTQSLQVLRLCALSADELLLACGDAGLRALSLDTGQLTAREPTALRGDVRRVAFDARTETLLLLVMAANGWQLVSLYRNASEWLEEQRLKTSLSSSVEMACATRVCCSEAGEWRSCTCSS